MKHCYAVDASYSFKDLVLSTPSWTLSSRKEEEEEEEEDRIIDAKSKTTLDDDFDAEKKTFIKKRNETQSFFARKRKTRGDHAEEQQQQQQLLSSKMNVRPKKSKPSLADALFATGSLADAASKSRAWGPPPGGETAETRRSALSEWHKTVDTFRDDYKAKRKAAVKRCKRVGVARGGGGFGKTIE